jgi:hypothetical protein
MLLYFAEVQHARQIARLACTVSSSGLTSQTVKLQKSSNFCLSSLKACDGMFQTLASLALTCPPPQHHPALLRCRKQHATLVSWGGYKQVA